MLITIRISQHKKAKHKIKSKGVCLPKVGQFSNRHKNEPNSHIGDMRIFTGVVIKKINNKLKEKMNKFGNKSQNPKKGLT